MLEKTVAQMLKVNLVEMSRADVLGRIVPKSFEEECCRKCSKKEL